jgi:hypothetical protein
MNSQYSQPSKWVLQNAGKDAAVLRRKPNNLGQITTENRVFHAHRFVDQRWQL